MELVIIKVYNEIIKYSRLELVYKNINIEDDENNSSISSLENISENNSMYSQDFSIGFKGMFINYDRLFKDN